jgi:hypothetical protein
MGTPFSWTCPYCNQIATITENNTSYDIHFFDKNNKDDDLGIKNSVVVCPNLRCREYVIQVNLYKAIYIQGRGQSITGDPIETWFLKPKSLSKPFPAYIPKIILDDYKEACLIVNDSPKASATLSRRCLQGIIRDFWKISKSRLIDEIKELEGKIDSSTWRAIDGVRSVGNIGAHMEKDIDVIVDVEPEEAKILIGLIEFLLKDWYVARHDREEHMQKVIDLAKHKADEKKALPPTP